MPNDFYRVEFGARSAARPAPRHAAEPTPLEVPVAHETPPQAPTAPPPIASDSVLVPLDQWNRLLGQLGNIHEAGQQLAEARERMGRAETENVFLKERIRDLRAQLEKDEAPATPEVPIGSDHPEAAPSPRRAVKVEFNVPDWLTRRRRRTR